MDSHRVQKVNNDIRYEEKTISLLKDFQKDISNHINKYLPFSIEQVYLIELLRLIEGILEYDIDNPFDFKYLSE